MLWATGKIPVEALQAGGSVHSREATQDNQTPGWSSRRALGPRSRCRGEHTLATADGYRPGSGAWSTRVCISDLRMARRRPGTEAAATDT